MIRKTLLFTLFAGVSLIPVVGQSQTFDPSLLTKPATDSWPTYSGDYSGQRYSTLDQINQKNVKNLSLAWSVSVSPGSRGSFGAPPVIVGGVGSSEIPGFASIRGALLQANGVLYATMPDNVWALDARDGHEIWHFFWKTKGGTHIGNRGVALYKDRLFFETPDDYLVALDSRTGKEIWHKEIADFALQYFSTMSPILIGNHLILGTGDDLDQPGYVESVDPETGDQQWRFYTVPIKAGDPGLDSWKNLDAASHGGGNVWVPGSYDPETHLYIFGTGNPSAAYTSQSRGPGANLFTCSLVAVNVDTGKMAWYYQTSPHDTHDFDSAQTPILINAPFDGKMRKLVLTAARNGYFFVLDRTTGEHLLTSKISDTVNWAEPNLDKDGHPVRIPAKDFDIAGALVSPPNQGVVNWQPPGFSPQTGLFYVQTEDAYSMYYLTTLDPRGAIGLGGKVEETLGSEGSFLTAIDYQTGRIAWRHRYPGVANYGVPNGVLITAGHLLFAGDTGGNLIAFNAAVGTPLWHSRIGVSNAPETYLLDGEQYVTVGAGDSVYSFKLNR